MGITSHTPLGVWYFDFNEISCTKIKFVFEQIGGKEENVIKEETKSWNETLKDIKEYGAL